MKKKISNIDEFRQALNEYKNSAEGTEFEYELNVNSLIGELMSAEEVSFLGYLFGASQYIDNTHEVA